jgi:[acyl-carrier-protein] S-malonyltransferase
MTTDLRAAAGAAVIFPGISPCRFADAGRFLVINPMARELTAIADDALGYSLVDRFRAAEGDYTEPERIAFLVVCLALAYWARSSLGLEAGICVGPSFGGTPAAVFSGALSFADAVTMTARWGRHLDDYFAVEHGDVVTQSFARTPKDRLAQIMAELDADGEWHDIAAHVDDDFHMLSLREHKLEWLHKRLRSVGGLPLYTMAPPMHSRAFGPLRDAIERDLFGELRFEDPDLPVVSDHDGKVLTTGAQIRTLLLDGVVRPVRWPEAVATLKSRGIGTVYVSGPDALWGRVDRTRASFEVVRLTPALALSPVSRPLTGQRIS